MGYGLERGGVNIDHGGDNRILHNSFVNEQVRRPPLGRRQPGLRKEGLGQGQRLCLDRLGHCRQHLRGRRPRIPLPRARRRDARAEQAGRRGQGDHRRSDLPGHARRPALAVAPLTVPAVRGLRQEAPGGRAAGTARPPEHHHDRVGSLGPRDAAGAAGQVRRRDGASTRSSKCLRRTCGWKPWATTCAASWRRCPGKRTNRRSPSAPSNPACAPTC